MLSYFFVSKGFYKDDNTTPNDVIVLESKQNSDAAGFKYQWGRKDPFTFATKADGGTSNPVKIYNAQGKEIVQTLDGGNDANGGITVVTEIASSMLETVRNPNTFYATDGYNFINQVELTKEVYDYYWTSYSRGTDGTGNWNQNGNPNWNNPYLDGYNQKRPKSIFDPCPYGFRLTVNGSLNKFSTSYVCWTRDTYVSGFEYIGSWFPALGIRWQSGGVFTTIGTYLTFWTSTIYNSSRSNLSVFNFDLKVSLNMNGTHSEGISIRCIEDFTGC